MTARCLGGISEPAATPSRRLTRACRLNTRREFERVFQSGRRYADRVFVVLTRRNGQDRARLGMVVPKRHAGRAVVRNRLKRVIREAFRNHRSLLAGLDVVVLVQAGTAEHTNAQLHESLLGHWRRAAARESWKASE